MSVQALLTLLANKSILDILAESVSLWIIHVQEGAFII
jgi:hypothetical protein